MMSSQVLLALSLIAGSTALTSSSPLQPVLVRSKQTSNRRAFFDASQRQLRFRGVNVVYKDSPFYPDIPNFHANLSFVEHDAKLLRALGINLIRLSVMWPGTHTDTPYSESDKTLKTKSAYLNSTYFDKVSDIIKLGEKYNIYSLLDPHQDEMHPVFCGEGAPGWWVNNPEPYSFDPSGKEPVIKNFPVPVAKNPFKNSPPTREECYAHSSFSYIFTEDASRAYQRLYETSGRPRDGVEGPYALFWQDVVEKFGTNPETYPTVLGGELWNEPFPGAVFRDSRIRDNKFADLNNLQPWYANLTAAIRKTEKESLSKGKLPFLVAYEPTWPVADQDLNPASILTATSGFSKNEFMKDNIYAFHYYVAPCDPNVEAYLTKRVADADRLEAAPFASEFNLAAWDENSEKSAAKQFDAFENEFQVDYTGWQYKSYSGSLPTGTCTGCGNSFYNNDGSLNIRMARSMGGRPFTSRVGGEISSIVSGEDHTEVYTPVEGHSEVVTIDLKRSQDFRELSVQSLRDSKVQGEGYQYTHRFYIVQWLVSGEELLKKNAEALSTELGMNELWLEIPNASHVLPPIARVWVENVESETELSELPHYHFLSIENRPSEVVVEGKVVIPASSTMTVGVNNEKLAKWKETKKSSSEDLGMYRVNVKVEFWARPEEENLPIYT